MDAGTAATTFATLVGLACNFRQEKSGREALDHQKFIEWLDYHHHEELKNLIVNTAALRTEVDNLLRSDQAQMLQKLDQIGEILVSLLSRLDGFRGIALALVPNADLSEQAISMLRQLTNSGADEMFYKNFGKGEFALELVNAGPIEVTEPRFIEDDLKHLAELQLISVRHSSQGAAIYRTTRNGVRLIEAVDGKSGG